jgi:hypothetical protein
MPRPGPRRVSFGARLFTPEEHAAVVQLAERHTQGNLSEMVRLLALAGMERLKLEGVVVVGEVSSREP